MVSEMSGGCLVAVLEIIVPKRQRLSEQWWVSGRVFGIVQSDGGLASSGGCLVAFSGLSQSDSGSLTLDTWLVHSFRRLPGRAQPSGRL